MHHAPSQPSMTGCGVLASRHYSSYSFCDQWASLQSLAQTEELQSGHHLVKSLCRSHHAQCYALICWCSTIKWAEECLFSHLIHMVMISLSRTVGYVSHEIKWASLWCFRINLHKFVQSFGRSSSGHRIKSLAQRAPAQHPQSACSVLKYNLY